MQKAFPILLLSLITVFSSCSYYDHKTKQLFYDQLSGTNDSLDKMTDDWHQMLEKAVASKSFAGLAPLRTKMGLFISRNRSKIANIEVPQNLEGLRDSEEVFLSNQANTISEAYSTFEPYNDITPNEEIQNQLKLVVSDEETESSASGAIRKSLQAFAQKNGLKVSQEIK